MLLNWSETGQLVIPGYFFFFFPPHSLLSTLKNKELSPVIGQKGIQGTMTSSGQSQHSEHSPHTLRRGKSGGGAANLLTKRRRKYRYFKFISGFMSVSSLKGREDLIKRQQGIVASSISEVALILRTKSQDISASYDHLFLKICVLNLPNLTEAEFSFD